jgi:hypothetical protein
MSLSDWNDSTLNKPEDSGTSFHLYALGSNSDDADVNGERNTSADADADADAVFYVKLSDMRAVFQFQRGTGTGTCDEVFDASSDIRYYVFRKYWPTALNLNPSHAMLDRDESSGMLRPNTGGTGAYSADKSLVKHDFLRYIALNLFNTIHGVDLFRNEEDLRENIAYYGEVARVGIMSVLDTVGTMSANIAMAVDSSGNRYSTNEDTTVTNISRELMRQIAVSAPGRLVAIDDAEGGGGAGIQSIPLSENDTLNFKVVMEASPGQNALTNVAAIPARTYNIKLIMKTSVAVAGGGGGGGGTYANTAATDSVSFPNGYPYAVNVYDISASNTSVAQSVYADGSPPVPIPLLRYGYQGWYYTNSDAWVNPAPSVRNKINWYMLPNSATTTVGDLRYVRMNLHMFSGVSAPFLTVYTKATGSGDAGGWYKSKRVYVVANTAATALTNNTNYCFYINWNEYSVVPFTVAHNNVSLSLTTVSSGAVGVFSNDEVLFAYSIGTDSGAARGNVDFILSGVVVGEGDGGGGVEKEYGYIPA